MAEASMRAVVTTGDAAAPVRMGSRAAPSPRENEALVRVRAFSLNAGEIRAARGRAAGEPIGWDFAGEVERAAASGQGPKAGARVVGFAPTGAWAERVAVSVDYLGALPDAVSFEDAATLPVAGLTALRGLERGGALSGKRVLVAPATGGVGLFGVQLAAAQGATVVGVVRRAERAEAARRAGAGAVVVGATEDARSRGPYDVVLESLGGDSLGSALTMLAPDGTVVSFGQTVSKMTTFDSSAFYATGGATLYGFILFHEARKRAVARDLERLAGMVAAGTLQTSVDATFGFDAVPDAVAAALSRAHPGKIVVRV
jgi:NADPH2:quinone reductase